MDNLIEETSLLLSMILTLQIQHKNQASFVYHVLESLRPASPRPRGPASPRPRGPASPRSRVPASPRSRVPASPRTYVSAWVPSP